MPRRAALITLPRIAPEAGQGVGDDVHLFGREVTSELAFDDGDMLFECLRVAAGPLWREHHQDAAAITGDRLATDQAAGFDAIHEAGHPTSREERPLLEILHPELPPTGPIRPTGRLAGRLGWQAAQP